MMSVYLIGGCVLLCFVPDLVQSTCVLESDFGFKINCAFKKSGLFRVRNLGGVKAHASIGFSLGDELGFEQSLTNLDPSRRRSVSLKNGAPPNLIDGESTPRSATKQEKRGKQNRIMMRPPAPSNRLNPSAMEKLSTLHRRVTTMQPIVVSGPSGPLASKINPPPKFTIAKPYPMGVPPFRPLPPKEDHLKVLPLTATKKIYTPLQVPQSKGPSLMYQSEHHKYRPQTHASTRPHLIRYSPTPIVLDNRFQYPTTLQPFIPMPISPQSAQAISIVSPPTFSDAPQTSSKLEPPISNFVDPVPQHVHNLATQLYPAHNTKKVDDYNTISGFGDDTSIKFTKDDINEKINEIAKAGNISVEAVEAAIALRQQQLLNKYASVQVPKTTTTTTTTTTTQAPLVFQPEPEEIVVPQMPPKKRAPTTGKVMNAPREYYPVGYEKNFDDNFQSKVELPDTNFHCGDQKYFPGLYGDENLGCMVFHVCALTDDGLVMKSFLCPESTLFDQTILKCNWWFYVDCKNTRKLYDTNIPVSKSYQLMKALTFFSSYKKDADDASRTANPEDVDGVKEAITILENQEKSNHQKTDIVQIVTPQPFSSESDENLSPVYRGRNIRNTTLSHNRKDDLQVSSTNNKPTSKNTESNNRSTESSKEKQLRRRQILRNSPAKTTTVTTTTTSTTVRPETSTLETKTKEVNVTEVKQEKLTDQIEHTNKEFQLIPVRRFYRSSAEMKDKEVIITSNEKVQIIRPTSNARLVGEYSTASATIAKLDEAILGKPFNHRFKKDTSRLAIVTPDRTSRR